MNEELVGAPDEEHQKAIKEFREKAMTRFEELTDKFVDLNNSFQKQLPVSTENHTITVKDNKAIAIVPLADLHLGASGTDYKKLCRDLRLIKDTEGVYAVGIGDWLNNFILNKLANAGWGDLRASYQWALVDLVIQILGDSLKNMISGNHENWTESQTDINYFLRIAEKNNIICAGKHHTAKMYFKFKDITYKGVFRHCPIGSSKINPMLGAKNIFRDLTEFDFCMAGHIHTFGIEHFVKSELVRVVLGCGTYKTDDSFGEKCGFAKAIPKMPALILMPDRREMLSFENLDTALSVLKVIRGD